jgi:integrase
MSRPSRIIWGSTAGRAKDDKQAYILAFLLLQIPNRSCCGVEAPDNGAKSRPCAVHRARGLRSGRGNPRTAADGNGPGEALIELRDRAILKFYLYTGARIETGYALNVSDFHQDGDEATVRFQLKGNRAKTKGIHFAAADAIAEYIKAAGLESGPLFRPRRAPRTDELAARRSTQRAMYTILTGYLERPPGALREKVLVSGEKIQECIYSPPPCARRQRRCSLMPGSPIESVQDLLDHKHITTTHIYDKRRRSVRDSASHKVPI